VKIALCDDDLGELVKVKESVDHFIRNKQSTHEITLNMFSNPNDLLDQIDKYGGFDLYILDIIMPFMNGIDLAKEIQYRNTSCKIIFLTSSPEFAVNSYKVDAFYYLLKPFVSNELDSLLSKVLAQMEKDASNSILIRELGKTTRIYIHTIQYVESVAHTIYFHLKSMEVLSCYGTMKEFDEILLTEKRFVRCHKSYIVNMDFVTSISRGDFILSDKKLIPISRQSFQRVKKMYIDYFFEKGNRLT